MRKVLSKVFWVLLGLIWVFIGVNWTLADQCEPIHEKIMEKKWEEFPPEFQELILFLMRVCSGMCLGIGLVNFFFLFGPFKKIWCCTNVYLFVLNFIALLPLTLVNIDKRFNRDPAILEPNWALALLSLVFAVLGFVLGFEKCTKGKCPCVGDCGMCCGGKKDEKKD